MKYALHILVSFSFLFFSETTEAQFQKHKNIATESEIDSKTYTGIISEQYPNGSPSVWKNYVNGKIEGLWLEWYPNGVLRYKAYWKNSLGNGKWEYFYPNGRLRSESFYINDIAQGLYKSYYDNGQIKSDATYLDGKKDGVEYTYDPNGVLLSRKLYENGILQIDEPLIFQQDIISVNNGNEWGISFMPDGNSAYFTRRDIETGKKRIYFTTKSKNDKWSTPIIAPFSTYEDEGAFINSDGSKFFFASYRPLPDGSTSHEMDMNIWYMDKTSTGWSSPKPLSSKINKSMVKGNEWPANYEAGPMIDSAGNLYFWTKGYNSNATNLFISTKESDDSLKKPIELFPVSSDLYYDASPQLSPDGKVLLFSSDDRLDGYGGSDIYYSVKTENSWSIPKNLGPIVNSSQSEGMPSFSPDGKYFYFSSNRRKPNDSNGHATWDIYHMETKFLMIQN